jgi:hypothetical protein
VRLRLGWRHRHHLARSNPRSGVTGILFTQRAANLPAPPPVVGDFWAAVNAATIG